MSTKHTPGPWTSDNWGNVYAVFKGGQEVRIIRANTICMQDEGPANGHLAAAGPEMLEALILVRDALDRYELPYKYTKMAEKAFGPQVRDAIAKATGEKA